MILSYWLIAWRARSAAGIALVAAAIGSPNAVRGQDELPLVGTSFEIKAPDFVDGLQSRVPELESKAVAKLSQLSTQHFPFLRWAPVAEVADRATLRGRVTVKLIAEPRPFAARILLDFSGEADGRDVTFNKVRPLVLYETWDSQPTHDPQRLQRDIADALEAEFAKDVFQKNLLEELIGGIPLASEVTVRNDRRLEVPLKARKLKAGNGTRLAVEFRSKVPATDAEAAEAEAKQGSLKLEKDGETIDGDAGLLRCVVRYFNFPPDESPAWHDRIPQVCEHVVAGTLKVFMLDYRFDTFADTREDLATTP